MKEFVTMCDGQLGPVIVADIGLIWPDDEKRRSVRVFSAPTSDIARSRGQDQTLVPQRVPKAAISKRVLPILFALKNDESLSSIFNH